jgi:hypothetical protein
MAELYPLSQSGDSADNEREPAAGDAMHITHRGVVLTVTARRNSEGAWLAAISAYVDGRPLDLPSVEPATPEWLTESEALRAGIEHGCYLVDRYVPHR